VRVYPLDPSFFFLLLFLSNMTTLRLCAKFVAINGPAFNQALFVRESQNPQFGFLVDPLHPNRELYLQVCLFCLVVGQ
jgi:hypothetical protein